MVARHQLRIDDPYDLDRFVEAQEGVYEQALAELKRGEKTTHWMWYIFPQFEGLGSSPNSRRYAIGTFDEARAYNRHPILGKRLWRCAQTVLRLKGRSAREIFGTPDDLKLRSCATLFDRVVAPGSVFHWLLDKYFQGQRDQKTLQLIVSKMDLADRADFESARRH
jgi:uncharacterized protein (DUF1810 family)